MITIKAEGIENLLGGLAGMKRQIPYAVMNGINSTAFDVRRVEVEAIDRVFPTAKPQTKKNVFVRKASLNNLTAAVLFDQIYAKGIDEYMKANIYGGNRTMKPSERRLNSFYVPGKGAKLDIYGNIQGGQVTQILSRLGRFGDVAGYNMNQTPASAKRLASQRRTGKKATEYFVVTQKTGGLMPGVYQRTATGASVGRQVSKQLGAGSFQKGRQGGGFFSVVRGRGVTPVLVFVKSAPRYKAVWPFFVAGKQTVETRLPVNMRIAVEAEIQKEMAYRARR